ncbi:MAG: hypothetical protein ACXWU1_04730 [Allosphingosinicella sp.]
MTMQGSARKWAPSAGRRLHRAPEAFAAVLDQQFPAAARNDRGEIAGEGRIDGKILNVRPDPVDFRDAVYQASLIELETWIWPPSLASLGLTVREQGAEGSCTGQALGAVVDMQNVRRHLRGADVPKRVSARMLYESARGFDEYADDRLPGSSVRGAIKGFFHRGVCGAELAPYFEGDIGWRLTVERAKDARRVTLGTYFRLRHVLNDYHSALSETRAILCSAMIHEGWSREAVARRQGRILLSADPKDVAPIGAHAFAIVGYDPDGFIVLNSWGEGWGGYDPATARGAGEERMAGAKPSVTATAQPGPLPGMAHWSYDDWRAHVLDAWVLRLQVPSRRPSGFAGGYHLLRRPTQIREDPLRAPASRVSVPAMDITGHFVHIADGLFVAAPPYGNDRNTFEETARLLREEHVPASDRYDHILLYAHGGLNDLDAATARVAAMAPVFKRMGVYPVFYLWHTGLLETTSDLLLHLFERVASRAGGFTDFSDTLFERAARPVGQPIWREMKADATRSFANGGDAWIATRILVDAAKARSRHPLSLHLVGHSAGAIFLGELFARARADRYPLDGVLGTISLFAPACTMAFFTKNLAPAARLLTGGAFAVYNLTDAAEQNDTVADFYRKSLLYLVSNAFEEQTQTPIAGMDKFWQAFPARRRLTYHLAGVGGAGHLPPASCSTSHGGFDNDPETMNHVLARILGKPRITDAQGGFSAADLSGVASEAALAARGLI